MLVMGPTSWMNNRSLFSASPQPAVPVPALSLRAGALNYLSRTHDLSLPALCGGPLAVSCFQYRSLRQTAVAVLLHKHRFVQDDTAANALFSTAGSLFVVNCSVSDDF